MNSRTFSPNPCKRGKSHHRTGQLQAYISLTLELSLILSPKAKIKDVLFHFDVSHYKGVISSPISWMTMHYFVRCLG